MRSLTYMVGGLVLLAAFYTWRFTVWAAEVGGYWNLVTGHRNPPSTGPGEAALKAAGKAATAYQSVSLIPPLIHFRPFLTKQSKTSKSTYASGTAKAGKGVSGGDTDIESQIFKLASALGVKPADLNNAIRPLVDPTAPNPAEAAKIEAEILKAKLAGGGAAIPEQGEKQEEGVGLLSALGEAFLD